MAQIWQLMDEDATAQRIATLEACLDGRRGDRYSTAWRLHLLIVVAQHFERIPHPKGEFSSQTMMDEMAEQLCSIARTNKNTFGEVVATGPIAEALMKRTAEREAAITCIRRELKPLFRTHQLKPRAIAAVTRLA